jgi:hypothetical protein
MPDDIKEPEEEPKEKPKKPKVGLQTVASDPVFEILVDRIVLVTDRQEYVKGQLVDLSHLPEKSIIALIKRGIYRTASGEPANVPAKTYPPCKHC